MNKNTKQNIINFIVIFIISFIINMVVGTALITYSVNKIMNDGTVINTLAEKIIESNSN